MYKIISKSRYSITFTIVDKSGNEIPVTLPRNQHTYSQKLTKSIRDRQAQGMLIVRFEEPKTPVTYESGGAAERMIIHQTTTSVFDYLNSRSLEELKSLAKSLGVAFGGNIGKSTLLNRLIDQKTTEIQNLI